jgi:hypothetical protein
MLHEEGQQIEDLRLKVDRFFTPMQFAALDVKPMVAKYKCHFRLPEAYRPARSAKS